MKSRILFYYKFYFNCYSKMTLTSRTNFDYRRLKAYRLLILLEQAVKMKEWLVSLIAELLVSMLLRLI